MVMRADCTRLAPCKHESLYYCRKHCEWWQYPRLCNLLSKQAKAIRMRKQAAKTKGGG